MNAEIRSRGCPSGHRTVMAGLSPSTPSPAHGSTEWSPNALDPRMFFRPIPDRETAAREHYIEVVDEIDRMFLGLPQARPVSSGQWITRKARSFRGIKRSQAGVPKDESSAEAGAARLARCERLARRQATRDREEHGGEAPVDPEMRTPTHSRVKANGGVVPGKERVELNASDGTPAGMRTASEFWLFI